MIIDVNTDLVEEILKLKKQKNAVILAHYYQMGEIQDIADFIGDSLQLAQQAQRTNADIILFSGVHFMAETAKILNPTKKVILPDLNAGCSLADSCPASDFKVFKEKYPDAVVISYINCTAEVKALSDIICTSSNAVKIVESIPKETPIIFAPDKNLGRYIIKKTGREMILWNGVCEVHEKFSLQKILQLKVQHPDALLIAHPECEEDVLNYADFIGSTSSLLNFVRTNNHQKFIVATESGILHQMQKYCPQKTFIPAPPNNTCACNECPYMKLNTLEKIYGALKDEQPEIQLSDELIEKAKKPLLKMLELSK